MTKLPTRDAPARTHWDRPAHFIGRADCRFGLCDVVNGYIVSTVGDYRPLGGGTRTPIGYDRHYETKVARWSGECCEFAGCPCGGIPIAEPMAGAGAGAGAWDIDVAGYQTEAEAVKGHARMVAKYARRWRVSRLYRVVVEGAHGASGLRDLDLLVERDSIAEARAWARDAFPRRAAQVSRAVDPLASRCAGCDSRPCCCGDTGSGSV